MQFQISFNSFMRVVMVPLLAGPRHCHVELTADQLEVKMGMGSWAFSAVVPRSSVVDVKRATGPVLGWGAHGWRGQWLINGSGQGLVRVSIEPTGRGRCLFVPIKVRVLTLSLEEPDKFVAALSERAA